MAGVTGPGQRHHANVEGEPEDNLARGSTAPLGDSRQFLSAQGFTIGGKQGESLVDKFVGGAELSDATIPAKDGVASVLHEAGSHAGPVAKALELFEGDVANAEKASLTAVVDGLHRPPGRPVVRRQASSAGGAVQQVGVDDLSPQMLKRAGKRLFDLDRDGGFGIVGQTMILPCPEGELGLQEQLIPGDQVALN